MAVVNRNGNGQRELHGAGGFLDAQGRSAGLTDDQHERRTGDGVAIEAPPSRAEPGQREHTAHLSYRQSRSQAKELWKALGWQTSTLENFLGSSDTGFANFVNRIFPTRLEVITGGTDVEARRMEQARMYGLYHLISQIGNGVSEILSWQISKDTGFEAGRNGQARANGADKNLEIRQALFVELETLAKRPERVESLIDLHEILKRTNKLRRSVGSAEQVLFDLQFGRATQKADALEGYAKQGRLLEKHDKRGFAGKVFHPFTSLRAMALKKAKPGALQRQAIAGYGPEEVAAIFSITNGQFFDSTQFLKQAAAKHSELEKKLMWESGNRFQLKKFGDQYNAILGDIFTVLPSARGLYEQGLSEALKNIEQSVKSDFLSIEEINKLKEQAVRTDGGIRRLREIGGMAEQEERQEDLELDELIVHRISKRTLYKKLMTRAVLADIIKLESEQSVDSLDATFSKVLSSPVFETPDKAAGFLTDLLMALQKVQLRLPEAERKIWTPANSIGLGNKLLFYRQMGKKYLGKHRIGEAEISNAFKYLRTRQQATAEQSQQSQQTGNTAERSDSEAPGNGRATEAQKGLSENNQLWKLQEKYDSLKHEIFVQEHIHPKVIAENSRALFTDLEKMTQRERIEFFKNNTDNQLQSDVYALEKLRLARAIWKKDYPNTDERHLAVQSLGLLSQALIRELRRRGADVPIVGFEFGSSENINRDSNQQAEKNK